VAGRGVIFVNPNSGGGNDLDEFAVKFGGHDVLECEPADLGEQLRKTLEADDDLAFVGVAGGDGSIRGAVEVLLGVSPSTPLLAVPAGTRNHFAHDLGLDEIDDAVQASNAGHPKTVDVGKVNETYFVNNSSVGVYPRLVAHREARESRMPKGVAAVVAAWHQLRFGRRIAVNIDGAPAIAWAVFVGNMVIDVGGGTSETALISLGGIVALQAVRVGSFDIDAAIQTYVRREYGIAVGERTAEEIKVAIGSAYPTLDEFKAEVRGRDLMSGLPKTVILSPEETREAIDEQVAAVVDSVIACLGQAPPELAQDLIVRGMYLVGGGGLLRGLDLRISEETEIPVHLVDAPLECVVLGAGRVIENYDRLKSMFMGARR
jgi:hypothetical protein